MSHPNALLTPKGRTLFARCIVEDGWPVRRDAERYQVSVSTAHRWATRYREHGEAGMHDQSSRPPYQPAQDTDPRRAADHRAPVQLPLGPGPDRLPAGPAPLDRAQGPLPVQHGAPVLAGPGHRQDHPPVRARSARRPSQRGHQEARAHSRRRRPPGAGPARCPAQQDRDRGEPAAGLRLPAQRGG